MPQLTNSRKIKIALRTVKNILISRPITVSFEITYNCNADCKHCDLGAYVEEPRLGPDVFAGWLKNLRPAVAQISGGEPMLRKDLFDIIKTMRQIDSTAVIVITTNVQLLNEEKYLKLKEAGVDQFSLSLDYPDKRQNEFRKLKNNFELMDDLIPRLAKYEYKDLILACVVQSDNFRDLPKIAELAQKWGAAVNFSTYNSLRTGNTEMLISKPDDLQDLKEVVNRLVKMQTDGYPILTSEWTMRQMIKFFENGYQPNCQAGRKFLIVNPWGELTPCGMCRDMFDSQRKLLNQFTKSNQCDKCFTAIRANSEKTPKRLLLDALRVVRQSNGSA